MKPPEKLHAMIASETRRDVYPAAKRVSDAITARHGAAVLATIFYGSCLRPSTDLDAVGAGSHADRILDFYAVVDDLRQVNDGLVSGFLNWLLPPNVFYIEVPMEAYRVRCKYAVVSLRQLQRATRVSTLQNYFWGRFCQPTAIVFARSADVRSHVEHALAQACMTMLHACAPLMDGPFEARRIWVEAFDRSYRAELRAEDPAARAQQLFKADRERYEAVAEIALADGQLDVVQQPDGTYVYRGTRRKAAEWAWRSRRVLGKTLNALRVLKAGFTFAGGIDYLVWKMERHSGVRLRLRPWERRHPVICAPVLAWRAWRAGAFR